MTVSEKDKELELQRLLNKITTYLLEGHLWHEKCKDYCVKLNLRGLARWHDIESQGDFKSLTEIKKYAIDNLKITPQEDKKRSTNALDYKIESKVDLREHLETWHTNEVEFIEVLKNSIKTLSDCNEVGGLYTLLSEQLIEVENEKMYIRILWDTLSYAQFSPQVVIFTMKCLHEYFEKEYSSGRIDFTII